MRQSGFSLGLVAVVARRLFRTSDNGTCEYSRLGCFGGSARRKTGLRARPRCVCLRELRVHGPTTAAGAGTVRGNLSGTFTAEYFDIAPQADGVINMHAHHTITRHRGTIMTSDEIRLLPDPDPAWIRPSSRLEVTGGTGAYEGATGLLLTAGRVNLNVAPPAGSIQFSGRLCVPDAEEDGDR